MFFHSRVKGKLRTERPVPNSIPNQRTWVGTESTTVTWKSSRRGRKKGRQGKDVGSVFSYTHNLCRRKTLSHLNPQSERPRLRFDLTEDYLKTVSVRHTGSHSTNHRDSEPKESLLLPLLSVWRECPTTRFITYSFVEIPWTIHESFPSTNDNNNGPHKTVTSDLEEVRGEVSRSSVETFNAGSPEVRRKKDDSIYLTT